MTTRSTIDHARTTTLPLRDRIRREWYLTRFDFAMQDYPRREFRQIKRDLRSELTLAALDLGVDRALADVGHPRVLAERYIAELGRRLPRWTSGAIAAAGAFAVVAYLVMAYSFGALDTIEAMGGGTVTYHPLGSEIVLTHTEDQISFESNGSWGWLALYAGVSAVAFVLGSRVWRVF